MIAMPEKNFKLQLQADGACTIEGIGQLMDLVRDWASLTAIRSRLSSMDAAEAAKLAGGPPAFEPFAKIARLSRDIVITEKIDGTNAQVWISDDLSTVMAGSRNRWLQPGKNTDNFGFARWVEDNREELLKLGPGRHFGEWWGCGIQSGYGLKEKRWSLFNVAKYELPENRPVCCHCVPVLYRGPFDMGWVNSRLDILQSSGSVAAPGWMKPEGIVIFHTASGHLYKKTIEKDELPKGARSNGQQSA